jgi:hypothetical protein
METLDFRAAETGAEVHLFSFGNREPQFTTVRAVSDAARVTGINMRPVTLSEWKRHALHAVHIDRARH